MVLFDLQVLMNHSILGEALRRGTFLSEFSGIQATPIKILGLLTSTFNIDTIHG